MFRELRRKKQQLNKKNTIDLLIKGTSGILAVLGDHDYPYAVPLSYVYHNDKIYFHSATTGHKLDAIKKHEKVSFAVIGSDDVKPEEFTTYYNSVVIFGKACIVEDHDEKMESLKVLTRKYSPNLEEAMEKEIESAFERLSMIAISIDHMTGKEGLELVKKRNENT